MAMMTLMRLSNFLTPKMMGRRTWSFSFLSFSIQGDLRGRVVRSHDPPREPKVGGGDQTDDCRGRHWWLRCHKQGSFQQNASEENLMILLFLPEGIEVGKFSLKIFLWLKNKTYFYSLGTDILYVNLSDGWFVYRSVHHSGEKFEIF